MALSTEQEDRLVAWCFLGCGLPALIAGSVYGFRIHADHPTEATITILFSIAVCLIVIVSTYPVLRSKPSDIPSQTASEPDFGRG